MGVHIGPHHPLDGITHPKHKLLRFLKSKSFVQRVEGSSI
jgi:hypothetical protein